MELTYTLDFTKQDLFNYNDSRVQYTDGVFSLVEKDDSYDDTNPAVVSLEKVYAQELYALETEETGDVTYVLRIDGEDQYWDGTAWVASDRSVAQSNSIDEINDNIGSLVDFTSVQLIFLLNSTGTENAILEGARFRYEPVEAEQPIETVKVFLNVRDFTNEIKELEFSVTPSIRGMINYKDTSIILPSVKNFKTNGGYIEVDLVETDNMEEDVYYTFRIGNVRLLKTIPAAESTVNLLTLPNYGA